MKAGKGKQALFKSFPCALGLAYACEPVCSVERPGRFAALPRGRYATLAFPVKSGNEGPECFFKGWAVFYVEIVSTAAKSVTFFLLSPLRLDDPAGARKRIIRKELDERKRLKDPLFFFLTDDDLKPLGL